MTHRRPKHRAHWVWEDSIFDRPSKREKKVARKSSKEKEIVKKHPERKLKFSEGLGFFAPKRKEPKKFAAVPVHNKPKQKTQIEVKAKAETPAQPQEINPFERQIKAERKESSVKGRVTFTQTVPTRNIIGQERMGEKNTKLTIGASPPTQTESINSSSEIS